MDGVSFAVYFWICVLVTKKINIGIKGLGRFSDGSNIERIGIDLLVGLRWAEGYNNFGNFHVQQIKNLYFYAIANCAP